MPKYDNIIKTKLHTVFVVGIFAFSVARFRHHLSSSHRRHLQHFHCHRLSRLPVSATWPWLFSPLHRQSSPDTASNRRQHKSGSRFLSNKLASGEKFINE